MPRRILLEMTEKQYETIKKASVFLYEQMNGKTHEENKDVRDLVVHLDSFLRQNKISKSNFVMSKISANV